MADRQNEKCVQKDQLARDAVGCERRVMGLALSHWEEQRLLCGQSRPPLESVALNHPVLKTHFYVVKMPPNLRDAQVIHCGGTLSILCGQDVVGQPLFHCLPRSIASERLDYLSAVASFKRPMAESGEFDLPGGGIAYFREALMPLQPIGTSAMVLGAINCRFEREKPNQRRLSMGWQ
jgi:hypothetical protein